MNNNCMVCGTFTRKRVTITSGNEVLEVAACDRHIAQARRGINQNLAANGVSATMRQTRFNPKKNKSDRRRVRRAMDIQDIIPGGHDTAMRPNDEGVLNK